MYNIVIQHFYRLYYFQGYYYITSMYLCALQYIPVAYLFNMLVCVPIQTVHPKGYQFWVFIGRTDVEAETPIFWPPDAKS